MNNICQLFRIFRISQLKIKMCVKCCHLFSTAQCNKPEVSVSTCNKSLAQCLSNTPNEISYRKEFDKIRCYVHQRDSVGILTRSGPCQETTLLFVHVFPCSGLDISMGLQNLPIIIANIRVVRKFNLANLSNHLLYNNDMWSQSCI